MPPIPKPHWLIVVLIAIVIVNSFAWLTGTIKKKQDALPGHAMVADNNTVFKWTPPDTNRLSINKDGELVLYGRDLIANTSFYLGPKGRVAAITNGMNCQNCHLEAGTKPWGNNYSGVFSTYPKFRERSGTVENIYKRVNDCIERSLNGRAIDTNSREMQAIAAYITWLGRNVPKNIIPDAAGIRAIPFLDRPADPVKGKQVYIQSCQRCHGEEGKGLLNEDSSKYTYPPLWGDHSYNIGAGLYRVTRLAGYLKDNMPFDAPHNVRHLTNEEAWDVAAFVNSRPRPQKDYSKDWPDISGKPIDHPFGPYADSFSVSQHKYGPFEPIRLAREKRNKEMGK